MSHRIGRLDQAQRAHEKQESRDRDAARLASGEIEREQLKRQNDLFAGVDFGNWRIVAIGGVPVGGRSDMLM